MAYDPNREVIIVWILSSRMGRIDKVTFPSARQAFRSVSSRAKGHGGAPRRSRPGEPQKLRKRQ